ncbi:MAG: hypothetical protein NC308_08030 [Clostridium sp.]|nr:hypothetical protein [Bacteroides sp.]MCM1198824.1 hypothetical protein [Clostridium sp.]
MRMTVRSWLPLALIADCYIGYSYVEPFLWQAGTMALLAFLYWGFRANGFLVNRNLYK